ncbi:MAG: hypothetical protein K2J93_02890 [Anaeroplasmataceae bacterium]|nr:hypothetical protein [Anaeroplasmataceae bacterium]
MEKKNKTLLLVSKIIIVIAFLSVVACTVIYFIEFDKPNKSFFSVHFALPIILFFIGLIAIIMSNLSRKSISGESKGDRMMIGVGLLLILFSILSLIFSFFL